MGSGWGSLSLCHTQVFQGSGKFQPMVITADLSWCMFLNMLWDLCGGKGCHGGRGSCLQKATSQSDERTKQEDETESPGGLRAAACQKENTALASTCPTESPLLALGKFCSWSDSYGYLLLILSHWDSLAKEINGARKTSMNSSVIW